ncbi:MAG: DeoR/GlpR transcriptional regulator [Cohaesibacteraceae bacterium]|nr:DeoR/GlpR transcriptional regulator [Cohaesibacteraceae bacterium]
MQTHINHREQEILRELHLAGGSCRIGFLAERLGVTDETIRRNIKLLESRGMVRKVHGGVHLPQELTEKPFQARMTKNTLAKQAIAARVAEIIADGDSLYLDTGTTTAFVAQALQDHKDLYVVTNSIDAASTLSRRNNNRVFFAGGELRSHDGGTFGLDALNFIQRFNVQYAVLSVAAIDARSGLMLHDLQEANFAKEAAHRAKTRILVADADKFERNAPIVVEDPGSFDVIVTNITPPDDVVVMLENNEIKIIVAKS